MVGWVCCCNGVSSCKLSQHLFYRMQDISGLAFTLCSSQKCKKKAAGYRFWQPLILKFDCVYLKMSGKNIFDPSGSTVKIAVVKSNCSSGSVAVKVMVSEPVQSGG